MKKIFLIGIVSIFAMACSTEENIESTVNSTDLTTLVNQNVYGIYTGIFTTLDSQNRGIINVIIPANSDAYFAAHNIPTATLKLENGTKISVTSNTEVESGQAINDMLFQNENISFSYSVAADGTNPTITNVVYNTVEGDIRLAKNIIGKDAVNPITGTFSCSDCKGHPKLTNDQQYTFNIMFPTGDNGDKTDVVSQILIPGAPNSPFGTSDNIQSSVITGTTRMQSTVSGSAIGGDLNWSSVYYRSNTSSCNAAIGTWSLVSSVVGETIEGVLETDNADICKEIFLNANFNSFTGAGFSPMPTAGQIDSDFVAIEVAATSSFDFGATEVSGDFARGFTTVAVGTGGIYGAEISTGDHCLLIQPTTSDFTPGSVKVRIQNLSGLDFANVQIKTDIYYRNDQTRSTNISLEYSTDDTTYTAVPGVSSFDTPLAPTGTALVLAAAMDREFSLSLADNAFLYLRVTTDDAGGSGSRDEIAIDNIQLIGY